MKRPKLRWKIRSPGFPLMIAGEESLGNGCECAYCKESSTIVAECFDGVVRELCASHYASRNITDINKV